jgi:broad specificity phosphatase PhoE
MAKTKRDKNEGKTAFAARVVAQYGDYISAKDAWERLVDKRGVGVRDWQRFQSQVVLSFAHSHAIACLYTHFSSSCSKITSNG